MARCKACDISSDPGVFSSYNNGLVVARGATFLILKNGDVYCNHCYSAPYENFLEDQETDTEDEDSEIELDKF